MTDFHFTPSDVAAEALKVPFFEDARAAFAPPARVPAIEIAPFPTGLKPGVPWRNFYGVSGHQIGVIVKGRQRTIPTSLIVNGQRS